MKTEIYECPQMTAPNYNRPGGMMTVRIGLLQVRLIQQMPNPASPNLPWPVISDVRVPVAAYEAHIKPSLSLPGCKLVDSYEDKNRS